VNLKLLSIGGCAASSDLALLSTLVNLQSLDICDDSSTALPDLSPLSTMVNLRKLQVLGWVGTSGDVDCGPYKKNLRPLRAMVNLEVDGRSVASFFRRASVFSHLGAL
jgi:hypothetical protein